MNNTTCTPPALNGEPLRVAPRGKPGPGACIPSKFSNLDCSGLRIVKRGCVVEFPGGATARVTRVRNGQFWHCGRFSFTPCRSVRVIA